MRSRRTMLTWFSKKKNMCQLVSLTRRRRPFTSYGSMAGEKVLILLAILSICVPGNLRRCYSANRVVAWGAGTNISNPADYNNYGQSIVPSSLTNAAFLAGGWRHSLAVKSDGLLEGWGDDTLGQIDFFPKVTNCVAISCGRLHSLALQQNGNVISAGDGGYGQATVPANLTNVVAIAAGFYHSVAL